MERKNIIKLVDEAILENQQLFLIDLIISSDNKITVIVDGDNGVPLKECIRISRHIEHNLDRDIIDFSLEVTSPGITEHLVNKRQYKKNLGRTLKITTELEKYKPDDITTQTQKKIASNFAICKYSYFLYETIRENGGWDNWSCPTGCAARTCRPTRGVEKRRTCPTPNRA